MQKIIVFRLYFPVQLADQRKSKLIIRMNIGAKRGKQPLKQNHNTRFGVLKKNLCDIFLSIRRTLHFAKQTQSVEEEIEIGKAKHWRLRPIYNKKKLSREKNALV